MVAGIAKLTALPSCDHWALSPSKSKRYQSVYNNKTGAAGSRSGRQNGNLVAHAAAVRRFG